MSQSNAGSLHLRCVKELTTSPNSLEDACRLPCPQPPRMALLGCSGQDEFSSHTSWATNRAFISLNPPSRQPTILGA